MTKEMRSFQRLFCFNKSKRRGRRFSACPVSIPNQHRTPLLNSVSDHDSFCLSLADQLVRRGLLPLANEVIRRIIVRSSSVFDAISAYDFASVRGMEFDSSCYGALMGKMLSFSEYKMGKALYHESVRTRGKGLGASQSDGGIWHQAELYNIQYNDFQMLEKRIVPDHVLFFTLLKRQPKGGEIRLALSLLQTVHHFFISSTLDVEIDYLLDKILRTNIDLAGTALNIYTMALCASGKRAEASLYLDKMVSHGIQPLISTYNSLLKCLFQEGLINDAKYLFEVMQNKGMVPDMVTYLIMVHEYCKKGDVESAYDILDQIYTRGIKPSVAIYDCVIGCLSRKRKIFEAVDVFKRMLEDGVDPDRAIFVTMINAFSKNGRAVYACQLFDKMVEMGIQPDDRAYTALINGLIGKGMLSKGCLYLDKMFRDGLEPNNVFYTCMINQSLKKRELDFALRLFNLMEWSQIEVDLVTCIALISGVGRNIRPTSRHYISRWNSRAKEDLFGLLQSKNVFMKPSRRNLNQFLDSQEVKMTILSNLISEIKETKYMPNLYLYNGIINSLCSANMTDEAYNHLEQMLRDGLQPNHTTFTILIDHHIQSNEISQAIRLFTMMDETGCIPDMISYNTLIKGLCKSGLTLYALLLSYTMRKRGFNPSKEAYENLLHRFCTDYSAIYAMRIVEDMLAHDLVPSHYNLRNLSRLQDTSVVWEMINTKKAMLEERKFRRGKLLDFLNPSSSSCLILSYASPQQRSF